MSNILEYYSGFREDMLKYLPANTSKLLDVGCGAGNFGRSVKKHNAAIELWGVELDRTASEQAAFIYKKVFNNTIEEAIESLPDNYFDAIVFNDVLEHLVDPWFILRKIKTKLSANGKLIASIPNILYAPAIASIILNSDFKYENSGTLDKTHLRFFTKKSIKRLFDESQYTIELIEGLTPTKGFKFFLFKLVTFNIIRDSDICQFGVVASPKNKK